MNEGADTFNLGSFGAVELGDDASGTVYGGNGIDVVTFTGLEPAVLTGLGGAADKIQEFEIFNFEGDGLTLSGTHAGWQEANFNLGETTLDGSLTATTGMIAAGATLNARDEAAFIGELTNSGTLTIGSSPGVFNLTGDFVQTADGLLAIEIFTDHPVYGTANDLFNITGSATLAGGLSLLFDTVPTEATDYIVIDAGGGIIGAFDTIIDDLPDIDVTLNYETNAFGFGFIPVAVEPEPEGESPDPEIEPEPEPEPLLSSKEIVPSGLMAGMAAGDLFTSSLMQREIEAHEAGGWGFWSTGLGGRYDVGNKDGQIGWEGGTTGFALGVQYLTDLNGAPFLFGFAGGSTVADLDSGASHGEVDSVHAGAFTRIELDALNLAGAVSFAGQEYDIERVIVFGDGAVIAQSDPEGSTLNLQTEAYYNLFAATPQFGAGPVLTFDHMIGTFDGFEEDGAGLLDLKYTGETSQTTVLGAGAEIHYVSDLLDALRVDTGLRVMWESVSGDTAIEQRSTLADLGGVFRPTSAALDADRVAIGADAKVFFTDSVFGYIRYDTARSKEFTSQEGWAGITIKF